MFTSIPRVSCTQDVVNCACIQVSSLLSRKSERMKSQRGQAYTHTLNSDSNN